MKKLLSLAATALLVLSAQAASINWTGAAQKTITNVDYSKDIKVVYSYTLSADIGGNSRQRLLWMGLDGGTTIDETNAIEFRYAPSFNGPNVIAFKNDTTYPRQLLANAMKEGDHTLTLVLNVGDGTLTGTHVGADNTPTNFTITLPNGLTYDETLIVDTNSLTALTASSTSVEYSETPEPTALALLALGVAGVALRRKVK